MLYPCALAVLILLASVACVVRSRTVTQFALGIPVVFATGVSIYLFIVILMGAWPTFWPHVLTGLSFQSRRYRFTLQLADRDTSAFQVTTGLGQAEGPQPGFESPPGQY